MSEGSVRELWRYPIKSMAGESISSTTIGANGILGDRGWVVRDESTGRFGTAKRIPGLFMMSARYMWEPESDESPAAEITLPDGWKVRSDNPKAAERVGEALEREVTLWPRQPAENLDFYRAPASTAADPRAEARVILGLEEGDEFPKTLAAMPQAGKGFMSPPGTYFDAFHILLVTTASLATLEASLGADSAALKRFRPNILVESPEGASGFPELEWSGRQVKVGGAILKAVTPCPRCSMIMLPQPGLEYDKPLMRHLIKETEQNFGMYLRVVQPGPVSLGDTVELV